MTWTMIDEMPLTGVVSANSISIEYLEFSDAIHPEETDPDQWEFHDPDCPVHLTRDAYDDCNCGYFDMFDPSYALYGDWFLDTATNQYDADPTGDFAAIWRYDSNVIQVVWSNYIARTAMCSPCYPFQIDLDTPGQYLGYDLPPDAYVSQLRDQYTIQQDCTIGRVPLRRGDTIEIINDRSHPHYGREYLIDLVAYSQADGKRYPSGWLRAHDMRAILAISGIPTSYFDAPLSYTIQEDDLHLSPLTFQWYRPRPGDPEVPYNESLELRPGDYLYTLDYRDMRILVLRRGDATFHSKIQDDDNLGSILNIGRLL